MAENTPDAVPSNAQDNAQRVRDYLEALFSGPAGLAGARAFLAERLEYHDPMMEARDADHLIEQIGGYGDMSGVRNVILEVIADGDLVAALTEFQGPEGVSIPFAQWFRLERGKITEIRVIYDPRPFLEMTAGGS